MTDSNEPLERLTETTEPLEQQLEQQINRYEAQLKHMDELLRRARAGAGEQAGMRAEIEKAQNDRDRMSEHLERLRKMPAAELSEKIIEKAGPMGMWDAVAQQLEKLVERIGRK